MGKIMMTIEAPAGLVIDSGAGPALSASIRNTPNSTIGVIARDRIVFNLTKDYFGKHKRKNDRA